MWRSLQGLFIANCDSYGAYSERIDAETRPSSMGCIKGFISKIFSDLSCQMVFLKNISRVAQRIIRGLRVIVHDCM